MKTEYKYIHFVEIDSNVIWECCSNKSDSKVLGIVYYYKSWNQFGFQGEKDCFFNNSCLRDIANFITKLNKKRGCKSDSKQ